MLGFDPYMIMTYKDKALRTAVALDEAKAASVEDALANPGKSAIYYRFMDSAKVKMAGHYDKTGKLIKGIEDYVSTAQYKRKEHREMVVQDILDNWLQYSHGGKFHAIFATSSIPEAIEYYRLLKARNPELKISALFDPNIDNDEGLTSQLKEEGLIQIITDYNALYEQTFHFGTHAKFKKDLAARLAHKDPYKRIELEPEKQIDLLIVVDQMLTGFDSKWINTLYLDKILKFENIIQAFSRTNRLFGHEKPFGTIRYYRKPYTMARLIKEAVELYSGNKPVGLFVQRLPENLNRMNEIFADIQKLFEDAGMPDFEKLPTDSESCGMFAKLFNQFNEHLEAAKIQGFKWEKSEYPFKDESDKGTIVMVFDKTTYLILAQRYKELLGGDREGGNPDVPFEIDGHLTEIDTEKIDADYMNSRFTKYLKALEAGEEMEQTRNDLHKTFATLTQEEQKYANIFLHDIERGDVKPLYGQTLREYITEYQTRAKDDQIYSLSKALGLDETLLREMMSLHLTDGNINEYGRYDRLKNSVDKTKAKAFFESTSGETLSPVKVIIAIDKTLRRFLVDGGFDLDGVS